MYSYRKPYYKKSYPVRPSRYYGSVYGRGKYVATKPKVYKKAKPSTQKTAKRVLKKAMSGDIAGATSGMIGSIINDPIGALGTAGGNPITKKIFQTITGMGEYKIKSNSIMGQDPPMMHGTGKTNNSIRIKHREYIGDVFSAQTPNTFKIQQIPINPTLGGAFPWLAPIASQFQMWRPMGIVYEFKSTSSDALNSTNTALGTVILATEYNSNAKAFANKQQMENSQYSTSCKPSLSMMHCIECDPSQMVLPRLYTQIMDLNPSRQSDLRFNQLAMFYYATTGMQGSNVNLGELWVTYDIELSFPIEKSESTNLGDHYKLGTAPTTSNYFGSSPALASTSNFGTILYGGNQILLPKGFNGNVIVVYSVTGDSGSLVPPTLTGSNGVTDLDIISAGVGNGYAVASTSTVTVETMLFAVEYQGDDTYPTITFSSGTLPANVTLGDLLINTIQFSN